jgi:hypothetical protein
LRYSWPNHLGSPSPFTKVSLAGSQLSF